MSLVRARLPASAHGAALRKIEAGWAPAGASAWVPAGSGLRVALPEVADGAVRLGEGEATLVVRPVGSRDVRGAVEEGALVFHDAWPGVDVVQIADAGRFEELRVVWSAESARRIDYRLELGTALRDVRVVGGEEGDVLEVVDRDGRARYRTTPLFAIDAKGTRHALRVAVRAEGGASIASVEVDASRFEFPLLIDPEWKGASGMSVARAGHTATLLKDGRVLVAGGFAGGSTYHSSTEIFDPKTKAWTAGPAMAKARAQHAAAALADGKVAVFGGNAGATYHADGELYDPATNSWSSLPSMGEARIRAAATVLASGRVLLSGGNSATATLSSATRFDPATRSFLPTSSMAVTRVDFTLTSLGGSRAIAAGGGPTAGGTSSEIYDEATNAWTKGPAMKIDRYHHRAVGLLDGRVLVAGGYQQGGPTIASTEAYDPKTNDWTVLPGLPFATASHVVSLLVDGRALSTDGTEAGKTALFDPSLNVWSAGPAAGAGHAQLAQLTALLDGGMLLTGGLNSAGSAASNAAKQLILGQGDPCKAATACTTGFCVDGVCCDSACTDQCAKCNAAGACVPHKGPPASGRPACTPASGDVCGPATCDGKDVTKCAAFVGSSGETVSCREKSCSDGKVILAATCNGTGACPAPTEVPCNGYRCAGTECKTSCSSQADCLDRYLCSEGKCLPAAPAQCVEGGTKLQEGDVLHDCAPYVCEGQACLQSCKDTKQCAAGYVCDQGQCVGSVGSDDGGCIIARRRSASFAAPFALLALAAFARRRARAMP